MERLAERQGRLPIPEPTRLDDPRLEAREAERQPQTRPGCPVAWTTRSRPSGAASGAQNRKPSASAAPARDGSRSHTARSRPGTRASSAAASNPTTPAPITNARSPTNGRASQRMFTAVSMLAASTARRSGTASGTGTHIATGATKRSWCGWRQKTRRSRHPAGAVLHHAHSRVAVLDRERELPAMSGARIAAHWLGGTRPSSTSRSVPRDTPDAELRTST